MNRWISRCLNIGTRFANINIKEIERAFKEVDEGKNVVLSFADHDFRDLRKDVKQAHEMITKVQKNFPNIKFKFSEASQAMREALQLEDKKHCEINMKLNKIDEKAHVLHVESNIDIFGPQPYLSIKTKQKEYFYDNFDFQVPKRKWTYSFDDETFQINKIEKLGIGVNNYSGQTTVSVLDVSSGKMNTTKHN